jgi:DNA repair exonuclease SbcCD ATPase subunit
MTILPCPFCGDDDPMFDEIAPDTYAVICQTCSTIGPSVHGEPSGVSADMEELICNATPEQAAAAWNSRGSADVRALIRWVREQSDEIERLRVTQCTMAYQDDEPCRAVAKKCDEIERLRADADRYIWLLAHMGRIEKRATQWNPARDAPLLRYLQDFIDAELPKAGNGWVARQRALLDEQRDEAQAEIERLRLEAAEDDAALAQAGHIYDQQIAEIERLRMERDEARKLMREWDAEVQRLRLENEKLAAAMSSDGADACGALVVAEAEIERLREIIADQQKDIACDEQRVADLMGDVQRQKLEIERLRAQLQTHVVANLKLSDEVEQLRGRAVYSGVIGRR